MSMENHLESVIKSLDAIRAELLFDEDIAAGLGDLVAVQHFLLALDSLKTAETQLRIALLVRASELCGRPR